MSVVAPRNAALPLFAVPPYPVRRFSVAEYEKLAEIGLLNEDDAVELLEGWIVRKTTKYPRHDAAIDILNQLLSRMLPDGWFPRCQNALVTSDSEPEPDLVVARGKPSDYWSNHPTPADVALVIEVSESSLRRDRRKRRIYSRAGVSAYWIVNLDADRIEVCTAPESALGEFQRREVVPLATALALQLGDGRVVTLPLDTAFSFA